VKNWKLEDFVFEVSFLLILSHRKHRTVKGGLGDTYAYFRSDAQKPTTTYFFELKTLKISCSAVEFFSDRDEVVLVIDEIGLTEELGFRQCDFPTVRKLSARRI
jgi:hypothetical protein